MTVDAVTDTLARSERIRLHTPEDFEGMRRAGRLAAECLDLLTPLVVPGVVTDELDRVAREFILDHGALPACLFYRGYAKTLCISPNHIVCHGIPGERSLREGDIVNIDVTVVVDGWHGDTSRMYPVGQIAPRSRRLIEVTYDALEKGLAEVKPGAHFGDIGEAIQKFVEAQRPVRWCTTSAATAWAGCSTTAPMCCTSAVAGPARS